MTPEQEAAPLLSNPLRNGVLLCTLAGERPCSCQLVPLTPDTAACAVLYGTALLMLGLFSATPCAFKAGAHLTAATTDHACCSSKSPGLRQLSARLLVQLPYRCYVP